MQPTKQPLSLDIKKNPTTIIKEEQADRHYPQAERGKKEIHPPYRGDEEEDIDRALDLFPYLDTRRRSFELAARA